MIGLSTIMYDPDGARIFSQAGLDGAAGFHDFRRRVSRRATLDGGVAIYDTGMSYGDMTILVEEPNATLEAVRYATRLVQSYEQVIVCTVEGAFLGVPESVENDDGTLRLTVWVKEKIS